jgi:hypothetical protein
MRRGGATDLDKAGMGVDVIREHGGWSEGSQTVFRYIEKDDSKKKEAAKALAGR